MKKYLLLSLLAAALVAAQAAKAAPAPPVKEPTPQPNYSKQGSLTGGKNVGQRLNEVFEKIINRGQPAPAPKPPPAPTPPPKTDYMSLGR